MAKTDNQQPRISDIFQCQRCGSCCQGETTVSLDEQDQERMVAALGMSREEVRERYWRITGNVVQMQIVDGHCVFYSDTEGCTVHAGRPWRCGQWPLHPSILADEANFTAIRSSCPGITRDLGYAEFCVILRRLQDEQERLQF